MSTRGLSLRPHARCVYTLCEATPVSRKTKPIPALTPEQIERFWSKVGRRGIDECWEWQGAPSGSGYGQLRLGGNPIKAHRLSYYLARHQDPGELLVCHTCDNPICVNPLHLFLGTDADNVADREAKHRRPPPQGERNGRAILTEEMIQLIRASREANIALAARFGVSDVAISYARSGKTWKTVA